MSKSAASKSKPKPNCIRIRGASQNNLKHLDIDIPLGAFTVVTGLSGAGKSSLVFDTLHAEGQRRYVETFSAYTRQFLDLLNKPQVDSIENIRPSIAIDQSNTVKTSRSTVGTITEITDYLKIWFAQNASLYDPETNELIEDDTPETIWQKTLNVHNNRQLLLTFKLTKPAKLTWPEILQNLSKQSYTRLLLPNKTTGTPTLHRIDTLLSQLQQNPTASKSTPAQGGAASPPPDAPKSAPAQHPAKTNTNRNPAGAAAPSDYSLVASRYSLLDNESVAFVVQDRLPITPETHQRFLDSAETALHFGQNQIHLFNADTLAPAGTFSRGLHSPTTNRHFRPATPALFSFNSPIGACPRCRGFGRIIEIDYNLAIPDKSLSIADGAIKPFHGEIYGMSKDDLTRAARRHKIPTNIPYADLSPAQQDFVINGEKTYRDIKASGGEYDYHSDLWYGVKGFFDWLESNTYKMHVRMVLAAYRAYNTCPDCHGARLQPESLCWKWQTRTLPQLYQLPISHLLQLLSTTPTGGARSPSAPSSLADKTTGTSTPSTGAAAPSAYSLVTSRYSLLDGGALAAALSRLRYLQQVGLDYLTLDRTSRTLSGGETQRVNLTSCLGASLTDTLFILDEPSIGLHPRDTDRLIRIIRSLTNAGNTVVVVEHDETLIRSADHIIEIGPEPGARGGSITHEGSLKKLLQNKKSITGAYLSQRLQIPAHTPRPVNKSTPRLRIQNASIHNIKNLSLQIPLQRLVALSGVSGSGKSTLLDNIIHQGLLIHRHQLAPNPAKLDGISTDIPLAGLHLLDQSPLTKTPRSNPALYSGIWDHVRKLFASTPAAQQAGLTHSSFSFNAGDGRCPHCNGLGAERIEMQFLSDIFVPCPVCEGRRFTPEVLAIIWNNHTLDSLLNTTITDALPIFADDPKIHSPLSALASLGLGYLTLGQPLNTLSGGEAQRLKLLQYLPSTNTNVGTSTQHALILLDEPTTGLHRHDISKLLQTLHRIIDAGHSIILIEHNLDVLKSADWIIELGPEAGENGGTLTAQGTPQQIANSATHTAPYLHSALNNIKTTSTFTSLGTPKQCDANVAQAAKPAPLASQPPAAPLHSLGAAAPSATVLTLTGARENNLKNLSLQIPHQQLSVVTGVSGSGKSTLAFDIIFAEGQRRFMESMSPYARQFTDQLPRPDIDQLAGIPPTVAIEQRLTRGSRKSTVATITEVAQYLRLLYAKLGVQHNPETGKPITPLTRPQLNQLLEKFLSTTTAKRARQLLLCAPVIRNRKGHHQPLADWAIKHNYTHLRIDGTITALDKFKKLDRYREHDIELVTANLKNISELTPSSSQIPSEGRAVSPRPPSPSKNLPPSKSPQRGSALLATHYSLLATALDAGQGTCVITDQTGKPLIHFSTRHTDLATGETFPELDPKNFSHNSPRGWCPACRGHGRLFPWMLESAQNPDATPEEKYLLESGIITTDSDLHSTGTLCPECHGERLNRVSRAVFLHLSPEKPKSKASKNTGSSSASSAIHYSPVTIPNSAISLPHLLQLTPKQLLATLQHLPRDSRTQLILTDILPQITHRLAFLDHVGLHYLTLDRPTDTLSGGEAQRIRLAAQLGTNLAGVLYVLDEPSIGLHARDNDQLIATLKTLRQKGNTLLVVEHDESLMQQADHLIDLGPAAGKHGGELLAEGTPAQVMHNKNSLTARYLRHPIPHPLRGTYRPV